VFKVTKKIYNPLVQRRCYPGEIIEIPETYLRSFEGYVERTNEPMPDNVSVPAATVAKKTLISKKKIGGDD